MENKEQNRLIAKFMDAEVTKPYSDYKDISGYIITYPEKKSPGMLKTYTDSSLEYHFNWNWIIEVVKKINELCKEMEAILPDYSDLDNSNGWRAWNYRRISVSTDININYNKIIKFIEWYNNK